MCRFWSEPGATSVPAVLALYGKTRPAIRWARSMTRVGVTPVKPVDIVNGMPLTLPVNEKLLGGWVVA